jgi:hypothetical protein
MVHTKHTELKKCKATIERLFDKNTNDTETMINRHFKKIYDLISASEKQIRNTHKTLKAKQKTNIDSYIVFSFNHFNSNK